MKRCILLVGFLLAVTSSPAISDEAAPLSDAQKAKIALIRAEIRAQIKRLKRLERKLIAAVKDEKSSPSGATPDKTVVPAAGEGLAGHAKVAGRDAGILFLYTHGKVLNPEPERQRIEGDFVLTLRGRLQVPRDMVVQVKHAGGGVSHDVNTLYVDDRKISAVGDDRSKHAVDELKLAKGPHSVRWELTAGTFRHNLLQFIDAETGKLLPLEFARDLLPDVPVNQVVRIGSEQRGWPIPQDW